MGRIYVLPQTSFDPASGYASPHWELGELIHKLHEGKWSWFGIANVLVKMHYYNKKNKCSLNGINADLVKEIFDLVKGIANRAEEMAKITKTDFNKKRLEGMKKELEDMEKQIFKIPERQIGISPNGMVFFPKDLCPEIIEEEN